MSDYHTAEMMAASSDDVLSHHTHHHDIHTMDGSHDLVPISSIYGPGYGIPRSPSRKRVGVDDDLDMAHAHINSLPAATMGMVPSHLDHGLMQHGANVQPPPKRTKAKRVYPNVKPFVGNLFDMLNDPDCHHAIRWSDDGLRVQLLSPPALELVLPKYFSHNNYRSLTKMLNANGFTKVPKKDAQGVEYRHEMFQRGRLDLLPSVARAPTPSSRAKKDGDDDDGMGQQPVSPSMSLHSDPTMPADIIGQYRRLVAENTNLRRENVALRQENSELRRAIQSAMDMNHEYA